MTDEPPILRVENYRQHFAVSKTFAIRAVNGVSFAVRRGEIFGLVGESGSGKTTVARAVMGLHKPTAGAVHFKNHTISDRASYRRGRADIGKNLQFIFQDSGAALSPTMRVRDIIAEPLLLNRLFPDKQALLRRVDELMAEVGLDAVYRNKYGNVLSGGQRQRVAIARALGPGPELIVADEPVAALDLSIQAQIIALFQRLRRQGAFTMLFIAHDLAMVRYLSDRVGVMRSGKLVETGPTEELFLNPLHPYTRSLLSAIPVPDPDVERERRALPFTGEIRPDAELREVEPGHFVLEG